MVDRTLNMRQTSTIMNLKTRTASQLNITPESRLSLESIRAVARSNYNGSPFAERPRDRRIHWKFTALPDPRSTAADLDRWKERVKGWREKKKRTREEHRTSLDFAFTSVYWAYALQIVNNSIYVNSHHMTWKCSLARTTYIK